MLIKEYYKPPTQYQIRKYRKIQKESRAHTVELCEKHPEDSLSFKCVVLFNFAYHAGYTPN